MSTENEHAIHKHMHVYSSDNTDLGQVVELYKESFLVRKGFFAKNRYFSYELILSVDNGRVNVRLSQVEAGQMKWEKRPDYAHHLGDPTQLFYDRGHGMHDPFDEAGSGRA